MLHITDLNAFGQTFLPKGRLRTCVVFLMIQVDDLDCRVLESCSHVCALRNCLKALPDVWTAHWDCRNCQGPYCTSSWREPSADNTQRRSMDECLHVRTFQEHTTCSTTSHTPLDKMHVKQKQATALQKPSTELLQFLVHHCHAEVTFQVNFSWGNDHSNGKTT